MKALNNTAQAEFGPFSHLQPNSEMQACSDKGWNVTERAWKVVSMGTISTWSLAVEDFRSKQATPRLLCNVGVVQLAETTDCRQEQVPKAHFPGFHLQPGMNVCTLFFRISLRIFYSCTFRSSIIPGVCHL